jgi:hypothetical protein
MIETSFKILVLIVGSVVVAINYFHTKEAKKMERKLNIALPGSVHLAMSLQMFFSISFIILATLFFLVV